jgi:signal recognition particle subunit SRP54
VNIQLVGRLRNNVLSKVALEGDNAGMPGAGFNRARLVERAVFDELVAMLTPGRESFRPRKGKANVVMFVGLQGAGKTTTVAKYAHYYQQRKWKVAMVCADTFRAGAFDQLRQNATRVRVPFYGSYSETDPVKIAGEGVEQFKREGYEIIIVDTSGRHKQEAALFEEMEQVAHAVKPDDVVFVMDGSIGQAAQAQAAAFKSSVAVGSVIITKLDGHAKGGGALSAVAATGAPIQFIGTGEHFDDLQPFDGQRFIGKLLGRGDLAGLAQEMKEKGIMEGQPEMMQRMAKGKFSLRDMRDQFEQVMKLGLASFADKLPGPMSQMLGNLPPGQDPNRVFKRFMIMMDSMTTAELDGDVEIDEARAVRIIRGSGVHPEEFSRMMATYKQFEKMIEGMAKTGLLKQDERKMMQQMKRDPKKVQQALQASINPQMLAQMGGAGGMMEFMKSMGMDGMPGMGGGGGGGGGGGLGALGNLLGGGGPGGGNPAAMAKNLQQMMKGMFG